MVPGKELSRASLAAGVLLPPLAAAEQLFLLFAFFGKSKHPPQISLLAKRSRSFINVHLPVCLVII